MKRSANKVKKNPGSRFVKAATRVAEDEIREVNTLYHTLFEQFPDAVTLVDPETTLPLAFNEKALELLGYTAEEFRRLPIAAYEAREQPEEIIKHVDQIMKRGRDEFATQMRTRQGVIKDVLINLQVVEINGRKLFNTIFRDITEQKQADIALKVHIRQQAVAAELGKLAIRGIPPEQLMDKIVIELAATLNVKYCKVLEWRPGQNIFLLRAGVGWRDGLVGMATVPDDKKSQAGYTLYAGGPVIVENLRTETRFSGPPFLHEHNVISGVSVIIQGEAGPWGVLGAHADRQRLFTPVEVNFLQTIANILAEAIERKTFIEILKKSEAKFRGLLESAADGIVISNAAGEIEMVNAHLETMTGYHRHELIGKPVEILLPERITGHEQFRREFLKNPQVRMMDTRGQILNVRRKDGSEFHAEIGLVPLQLETDIVVSVTIRDMTHRMQDEQISRQTQDRLRRLTTRLHAAREEERTRVAREIHDELGQSLTGLKMDLSWILARVPKKLKILSERIQGTIALVESTINFVRRLATSLRPAILDDLGLGAAIEWQIQGFAARTGCRYKLEIDCPEFVAVNDRDTTVFRIFQEALTNTARHARADYVDVSLRMNNTRLLLSIIDNGIGIPQQKLTDNHSLGLIGMRERASAIGGDVKIEAVNGGGTRVSLIIPLTYRTS